MLPFDFFRRAARLWPDQPAVITDDETLTFAQLADRVLRLAALLVDLDAAPQTRVAVSARNSADHIAAILAVAAAGKIWVPINPRNGDTEIARGIEITAPSILLLDAQMMDRIGTNVGEKILLDDGSESTMRRSVRYEPLRDSLTSPDVTGVQAIKFTGGTSGAPKGAMQSYRCWNTKIASQCYAYGFNATDRFLVTTPLTHGASTYLLPVLGSGGAIVIPEASSPAAIVEALPRHKITTMFMPPTQLTACADHAQQGGVDSRSLRRIVYGAAPMRPDRIRQAQEVFGPVIACTYGQAEAPQIIAVMSPQELTQDANLTAAGRPSLLTKIMIEGAEHSPARPGEQGEILVRGDLVMNGYWNLPELTAKTIVDGWLRTGDVGFLDERGYLFIRDRSKEIIITGGFNVYPSDVESALSLQPAVAYCAVLGLPDEKWGEAVHAAVELRPGFTIDRNEVLRELRSTLGPVQTPKHLHVFEDLPRSPVGKILKTEIRKMIERGGNL
ncbi:MAG: AMP-binding protein [Methylobacteriaceae bacterium]|nr:AMP-binding protein [Methylobacteriaceae bacterium]